MRSGRLHGGRVDDDGADLPVLVDAQAEHEQGGLHRDRHRDLVGEGEAVGGLPVLVAQQPVGDLTEQGALVVVEPGPHRHLVPDDLLPLVGQALASVQHGRSRARCRAPRQSRPFPDRGPTGCHHGGHGPGHRGFRLVGLLRRRRRCRRGPRRAAVRRHVGQRQGDPLLRLAPAAGDRDGGAAVGHADLGQRRPDPRSDRRPARGRPARDRRRGVGLRPDPRVAGGPGDRAGQCRARAEPPGHRAARAVPGRHAAGSRRRRHRAGRLHLRPLPRRGCHPAVVRGRGDQRVGPADRDPPLSDRC